MRYTSIFSIFLLFLMTGCNKTKYETTPSLKFESVNTKELHREQLLKFTLSFTDAEGDISNVISVKKIVPNCSDSEYDQDYDVPKFPATKNQKGEIVVQFGYGGDYSGFQVGDPQCMENDTAVFKFALKDLAGHVSDTVSSPPIIIYK